MIPQGKKHPDFPNYIITERGEVYSLYQNKFKKLFINKGYKRVQLIQGKTRKHFTIHRLVATLYIDNPKNYPMINHIDGNPFNNTVSNLEWCNASHNLKHAYDNRLRKLPIGELNNSARLTKENVIELRKLYEEGLDQYKLAKKFGISQQHVSAIVTRRYWRHI